MRMRVGLSEAGYPLSIMADPIDSAALTELRKCDVHPSDGTSKAHPSDGTSKAHPSDGTSKSIPVMAEVPDVRRRKIFCRDSSFVSRL